jgi:shikimate kinase
MSKQNIYLIGPMGAGKTSIGKILAKELNMDFYDSDQVIESRAGADILWIYDLEGDEGFRQREIKVIAELVQLQNIVLATGGGTVISAENRSALADNGIIVYLKTSLDDQVKRTGRSKKRPLSREVEQRRSALINLRQECEPLYQELAEIVCNTDGKTTHAIVASIAKMVQALKK